MTREELALLWFDYNDVDFFKTEKFLEKFDNIDDVFNKKLVENAFFDDLSLNRIKEKLLSVDEENFSKSITDEFYKYNIDAVTYISKNYPEKLKNLSDPPLILYVKGDVSLLNKKSISIIGSRKPSDYGKIVCEKFTKELSSTGLVTVSGLAYGIDTLVAETTLSVGGKTIAVLAGGLDSIYPAQNKNLSEKIIKNGLLVSENRIGIKPQSWLFVNRNRIVSGLGLGTLIVEAGKNSGTMTTARHAIEQGRELFVVPGNITSQNSEGTNQLIDEIPDTFTISPDRILMKLKIKKKTENQSNNIEGVQVDLVQSEILNLLSSGELSFDELSEKTNIKPSKLSSELIKMEMFGLIKKGDSNTYYKL